MLKADCAKYTLDFTFEARTSRGSMWHKPTYLVRVWDDSDPCVRGVGECNLFPGLSAEDVPGYELRLQEALLNIEGYAWDVPSINFGLETALADMRNGGNRQPFPSPWSQGSGAISINGLVWMGCKELMLQRVEEKLSQGFRCLKLKIGGISFEDELAILHAIRQRFAADELQLRLDANGAFTAEEAMAKLERLSAYSVHSIEQPIMAGQQDEMAEICANSPIPIALDEELLGMHTAEEKRAMLDYIHPQYIILKPALCGGFREADRWICEAEKRGIGWWATSALESNVGLNAIAQWVAQKRTILPQGLGTGSLYSNNVPSPIELEGNSLRYNSAAKWEFSCVDWLPANELLC